VRGDLYGTPGERLGLRPLLRASALATPNTTTVRDVEIVQTGIEYPLSTGPTTFTVEDLSDLVESQDDPAIQTPRLKMGHFANLGLLEDGQPAVGTVGNLRLEQEGHLVVGDYIGIPTWLAEILPSAYPARSIEAAQGVTTNTGHNWRLVLTDLALLGVVWPGVGTLEDIQALYSEEGPDNIRILTTKEEVDQTMARAARGVTAQVDTEVVRRSYYDDLGADQFWWWIRSMLVDPSELIVEDEESGDLYRVPYEIKGDEVTFGDPVAVKIVYKDKPSSQQPGNTEAAWEVPALPKGSTVAVYANRAESRPEQEGSDVTIASEVDPVALRTSLGLAEDASDDEVRTQLAAAGFVAPPGHEVPGASTTAPGSEVPGTSATAEHVPGGPDNTATSGPTDPAEAAPVTTPPTGTVTVDAAVWQDTRRQAQQGATAFQRLEGQDRDGAIAAAIQEGRIPPSRRTHWEQSWERDPEGTRTLLTAAEDKGGLAKGLIPVKATGQSGPLEDTTVEAYPADWLPEVKRGE
jgi:hypothetical protein